MKKLFLFILLVMLGLHNAMANPGILYSLAVTPPETKVGTVEFLSNYNPGTLNSQISRVVIIIHGFHRNPQKSFDAIYEIYAPTSAKNHTLIIAPKFSSEQDPIQESLVFWNHRTWSSGQGSENFEKISSFTVVDLLLLKILKSGNFPNIKKVIITGHSAGGQFTQRYAAGTRIDQQFPEVHFKFIVGCPSSFLYLDSQRWTKNPLDPFKTPTASDCPHFNHYKFGLEKRSDYSEYMNQIPALELVQNYLNRDVIYVVGAQDNATVPSAKYDPNDVKNSHDLDVSCSAQLQGQSRLDRTRLYKQYLDFLYPKHSHLEIIVPDAAHELKIMRNESVLHHFLK